MKEKYCYTNVYKAVSEFIKDLKSAMNYVDIDETALYFLNDSMNLYFEAIDEAVKTKIMQFEECVNGY